jgi:hypothetical protein
MHVLEKGNLLRALHVSASIARGIVVTTGDRNLASLPRLEPASADGVVEDRGANAKPGIMVELDHQRLHAIQPAEIGLIEDHGFGAFDVDLQDGDAIDAGSVHEGGHVKAGNRPAFRDLLGPVPAVAVRRFSHFERAAMGPQCPLDALGSGAVRCEIAREAAEVVGIGFKGYHTAGRIAREEIGGGIPDVGTAVDNHVRLLVAGDGGVFDLVENLPEDSVVARVGAASQRMSGEDGAHDQFRAGGDPLQAKFLYPIEQREPARADHALLHHAIAGAIGPAAGNGQRAKVSPHRLTQPCRYPQQRASTAIVPA